jgi:uncharacterized SAM-binding protein YcdF (DUF218 family)
VFLLLSKTFDLAFAPLTWVLVLLVVGLVRRSSRGWAVGATLGALGVLYLFSIEPVSNALERTLETPPVRTVRPETTYDAAVLLGGLVDERSTNSFHAPSYNDNNERLVAAYDLLRGGRARTVIVTGGFVDAKDDEGAEASVLARQLEAWGIAKNRILVEPRALNTRENAVETAKIVREKGFNRLVLVTSAFHMKRALGCFRAVGLEPDALPVDFRSYDPALYGSSWTPRAQHLQESTAALREIAGRIVYKLRGYTA